MSRRIEIEITSVNGETATWRAAGAKLPKGSLATALLPSGSSVGSVYRADVEQYMEGIEVLSVTPPKGASPLDPNNERLELIPAKQSEGTVTVTYAPKGRTRDGGRGPREGRGGRPDRKDGARPPRGDGDRAPRGEGRSESRGPRTEGRSDARRGRSDRPDRTRTPSEPTVSTVHRNAFLATLSPEQLPVAEQLMRGGMPAVRKAVAEQNTNAAAQGRPTVDAVTIERIAEDLLGKTNLALWKDRASGAIADGRALKLRDLRAVVTAAKTLTLDEEGRAQLKELQSSLTERLNYLRTQWVAKLEKAIAGKQVREALELVARPPDSATRVTGEMATQVVEMTSSFLNADTESNAWREIVELAVTTSIRRNIKPQGIPANEDCRAVAVHNAGAIPELAKLLGMKVPPPPPPTKTIRRPRPKQS